MAGPAVHIALEESPRWEGAAATAPFRVSSNVFTFPLTSGGITPNPQHLDRRDEMRGTFSPPPMLIDGHEPAGSLAERMHPNSLVVFLHMAGLVGTVEQGDGANAVRTLTITGAPTGGSFTLTYSAQTTAAIPYNATARQVKAALQALSNIGELDVEVTGGPFPATPIVVTFRRALGCQAITLTDTDTGLTGGTTPAVTVTSTVAGSASTVTDPDGYGVPTGAYLWTFAKRQTATAQSAQIIVAYPMHEFWQKGQGYGIQSLTANAAGELGLDLIGLVAKPIDDPSIVGSVDTQDVHPLRRGDFELTWGNGSLAYVQDFSVSMANPLERGDHLGFRSYYPKTLEHTDIASLTGSIGRRQIDRADYESLIYADEIEGKAAWVGDSNIGNTGSPYAAWLEMPKVQHTGGGPEAASNRRRFPASFDFAAGYSESAGYDFRWSVLCAVPQVATYV